MRLPSVWNDQRLLFSVMTKRIAEVGNETRFQRLSGSLERRICPVKSACGQHLLLLWFIRCTQLLICSKVCMTVFSRLPLSRLTFLKVVCVQTSLSDLKMIRVRINEERAVNAIIKIIIKHACCISDSLSYLLRWLKFNENSIKICRLA